MADICLSREFRPTLLKRISNVYEEGESENLQNFVQELIPKQYRSQYVITTKEIIITTSSIGRPTIRLLRFLMNGLRELDIYEGQFLGLTSQNWIIPVRKIENYYYNQSGSGLFVIYLRKEWI